MFLRADEILLHSVKGITDLIMMPGLVNLDFADVKTTMAKAGMAIMGIGIATGENRAVEASERAMSHPLLEDIPIAGAKGVLMNITSNSDMEFEEVAEASERIHAEVGDDADIFWGTSVLATGIGAEEQRAEFVSETVDLPLRGRVRDITPGDLERGIIDYEEPTFIRQQKAVGESGGAVYRGHQGLTAEDSELENAGSIFKQALGSEKSNLFYWSD
jgi:cell division protein FtsZ